MEIYNNGACIPIAIYRDIDNENNEGCSTVSCNDHILGLGRSWYHGHYMVFVDV